MKILVTGGAGFIGSNFINYWLKNNPQDEIINLDLLTYAGNLNNLKEVKSLSNYSFIKGDICDLALVDRLASLVQLIVHFAAESHVDRSIIDSASFIKTNVEGTRVLLEAAKKYNLRFHHVSTDEVFGSLKETDTAFTEKTPYDPRSPYSASKAASDHLVRAYFHTHNLKITISNCSNNYGPRQNQEKLIPLFINNLLQGKKIKLYGDGQNIRDWIHVDDHNRGLELIIKKGKIGETYCLGSNQELRNITIANHLVELIYPLITKPEFKKEELIEFISDRPGHDYRYAIDFSKAHQELGFEPQVPLLEGLKETITWYQNNI